MSNGLTHEQVTHQLKVITALVETWALSPHLHLCEILGKLFPITNICHVVDDVLVKALQNHCREAMFENTFGVYGLGDKNEQ